MVAAPQFVSAIAASPNPEAVKGKVTLGSLFYHLYWFKY